MPQIFGWTLIVAAVVIAMSAIRSCNNQDSDDHAYEYVADSGNALGHNSREYRDVAELVESKDDTVTSKKSAQDRIGPSRNPPEKSAVSSSIQTETENERLLNLTTKGRNILRKARDEEGRRMFATQAEQGAAEKVQQRLANPGLPTPVDVHRRAVRDAKKQQQEDGIAIRAFTKRGLPVPQAKAMLSVLRKMQTGQQLEPHELGMVYGAEGAALILKYRTDTDPNYLAAQSAMTAMQAMMGQGTYAHVDGQGVTIVRDNATFTFRKDGFRQSFLRSGLYQHYKDSTGTTGWTHFGADAHYHDYKNNGDGWHRNGWTFPENPAADTYGHPGKLAPAAPLRPLRPLRPLWPLPPLPPLGY